jgi:hypothetical protein
MVYPSDVPDFLVLASRYDAALANPLAAKEACVMIFEEDGHPVPYSGAVVVARSSSGDRRFQASLWESVVVSWAGSKEVMRVSPWELERDAEVLLAPVRVADPPAVTAAELRELVELASDQAYALFTDPVDEAEYPDYPLVVGCPMDLSLLTERARAGFYRSRDAARADAALIAINAKTYNEEGSPITAAADALVEELLRILGPRPQAE